VSLFTNYLHEVRPNKPDRYLKGNHSSKP